MLGLAVVVSVGSTALAAVPGDPLKLGRINTVDAVTRLIGTKNNALLRVENDSKGQKVRNVEHVRIELLRDGPTRGRESAPGIPDGNGKTRQGAVPRSKTPRGGSTPKEVASCPLK